MAVALCQLFLLLTLLSTGRSDPIPCAWFEARVGTVRDALYIDGGQFWMNSWGGSGWTDNLGSNITDVKAGEVYRFNYSSNFDSSTRADITKLLTLMPLTAGGSYDAPNYADGAMLVDNHDFYTFGGVPTTTVVSYNQQIVQYRLFPATGQTAFVPGPVSNYQLPSGITNFITHGASVCAPSESLCFFFSGVHAAGYGPLFSGADSSSPFKASVLANSLLTIDMSNPQEAAWHNNTLDSTVTPRASGALVWVPVSQKGVLLAIGGVLDPIDLNQLLTTDDNSTAQNTNQGFMTKIPVYDVAAGKWTLQQTYGEAPLQLAHFCAVVANASNNQFDVFVYGGGNGVNAGTPDTYVQDQVWILSLPSFTWVKGPSGNNAHSRSSHACSLPYPNQMLVVGGQNPNENNYCIQDGSLIDVFDLNTLSWTGKYNPNTWSRYQRPTQIASAVASPTGAIDPTVASLFATSYQSQIVEYFPYKSNVSSSSTPIGPIVGGVVGGIAVIAVLVLAWFYWPSRRRARKERSRPQSETGTGTTANSNHVGRWIAGVSDQPLEEKPFDIISDTATERDESRSPPIGTAEVFGDTYFSPVRRTTDGNRPINGYSTSPGHSPLPPRSPRSMHSSSVEADGEQVHELHNESRNSKLSSELNPAGHAFRNHPMYPHSIDGHLSNRAVPSDMSPASHPTDRLGATSPGPVPSELSEHGDTDTHLTTTSSDRVGTANTVSPTRPGHVRNSSSMSSGVPITPPAVADDYSRRTEMAQQRYSGVVSPLMQQEAHRPAHHRHGSSLSEMLLTPAGEPAAPREADEDGERTLVNSPTSPNSNIPRRKPLQSAYESTNRRMP